MLTGREPPSKNTVSYYERWSARKCRTALARPEHPVHGRWVHPRLVEPRRSGRPWPPVHFLPPQAGAPAAAPRHTDDPLVARPDVKLTDASPQLELYGGLDAECAVVLVRAARQFQQASRSPMNPPGWRGFCSSARWRPPPRSSRRSPPGSTCSENCNPHGLPYQPTSADVLECSPHPDAASVAKEISRQGIPFAKVRALVVAHRPAEPHERPTGLSAIDWNNPDDLVKQISSLRSKAVREGLPIPAPPLDPSVPVKPPAAERLAGTIGSGDSVSDSGRHADVFAHVRLHRPRRFAKLVVVARRGTDGSVGSVLAALGRCELKEGKRDCGVAGVSTLGGVSRNSCAIEWGSNATKCIDSVSQRSRGFAALKDSTTSSCV